jgi:hypothetical protein
MAPVISPERYKLRFGGNWSDAVSREGREVYCRFKVPENIIPLSSVALLLFRPTSSCYYYYYHCYYYPATLLLFLPRTHARAHAHTCTHTHTHVSQFLKTLKNISGEREIAGGAADHILK